MSENHSDDDGAAAEVPGKRGISRRKFLEAGLATGVGLGAGGILAACGDDGAATSSTVRPVTSTTAGTAATSSTARPVTSTTAAAEIKRGGRLRVGHVGAANAEMFNPAFANATIDYGRVMNVYDPFIRTNPDLSTSPGLITEWNPNSDATTWELKLRPDVVWHNGKSVTADDVIYTLRSMGDPSHFAGIAVLSVELDDLQKVDDLTVRVPLRRPRARLWESFQVYHTFMIQDGQTDFTAPIGTGPFMFEEFSVGERSLCVRNPNYWDDGKPYVDEVEDISIADATARVNALLAGEVDAISDMAFVDAQAQAGRGDMQTIVADAPLGHLMFMAVDVEPFNDPLVRQALRLIPDRQALVDGALLGYGTPGNDLVGKGVPYFADDLPVREQDLEQAKSLLKRAGFEDLQVTLQTSPVAAGWVEAATLFAEQAKGAGVSVEVKRELATAYLDPSILYLNMPFGSSMWVAWSQSMHYEFNMMSDSFFNETHWRDPAFDTLVLDAMAELDEERAAERWREVQQIQYDEGGNIVWGNGQFVDGAANHVRGIEPSSYWTLGGVDYRNVWLDQ